MRSLFMVAVLLGGIHPLAARQLPQPPVDDQLTLAQQFLREFFPQLAGRTAFVEYTSRQPVQALSPTLSLTFRVVDLCLRAPGQNAAPVGNQQRPCFEFDKHYQSPLLGEFSFQKIRGRFVVAEAVFRGTIVNSHEPDSHFQSCPLGEVHLRQDAVRKLQPQKLAYFLGALPHIDTVGKEPGNPAWTVNLTVPAKHGSRYFLILDECGSIIHLGKAS